MPHSEHPSIESNSMKMLTSGSTIAFLFLIFQYTFKLDFKCPCDAFNNVCFCGMYFFLPSVGLFIVLTLTTKTFPIKCRLCFLNAPSGIYRRCCWITLKHIMRNLFLSVLWIVTILIDGDAYVCWKLTDIHGKMNWTDQLPCKEKNKLTADESENITKCQSESQVYGLVFLFALPAIFLLISIIRQCYLTPYKSLFEDVYEEETSTAVEVEIRENIKINAKEKLKNILDDCTYDDEGLKNFSDRLTSLNFEYNPASMTDRSEASSPTLENESISKFISS